MNLLKLSIRLQQFGLTATSVGLIIFLLTDGSWFQLGSCAVILAAGSYQLRWTLRSR